MGFNSKNTVDIYSKIRFLFPFFVLYCHLFMVVVCYVISRVKKCPHKQFHLRIMII